MKKLIAAIVVLGSFALAGCHTESPTLNCIDSNPFPQNFTVTKAWAEPLPNGDIRYGCHARGNISQALICWHTLQSNHNAVLVNCFP